MEFRCEGAWINVEREEFRKSEVFRERILLLVEGITVFLEEEIEFLVEAFAYFIETTDEQGAERSHIVVDDCFLRGNVSLEFPEVHLVVVLPFLQARVRRVDLVQNRFVRRGYRFHFRCDFREIRVDRFECRFMRLAVLRVVHLA